VATVAEPLSRRGAPVWPGIAALGAALAFVAASWYLKFVVGGYWFGAPLAPLYLYPDPEASAAAPAAVAVLALATWLGGRLGTASLRPAAFALLALFLAAAARLALALVRDGTSGWLASLGRGDGANEYLPALPALSLGRGAFLDRFAEVAPTLPTHPSAHPPGLLLAIDALGIETPVAMAAFQTAGGLLAVPLVYGLARRLLPETGARAATLLFAFSPAIMTYGVTSSDALYVTAGSLAALLLVLRPAVARTAGAVALALASFLSYALLAVGAWATVVAALRSGIARAVTLAGACAVALAGLYAALWVLTGFDVLGALRSADLVYRIGPYFVRPYWYWVLGSPVAWLVSIGLPLTWYAARGLGAGHPAAVALAVIVAVAALGGYTMSETERIWMFMVPFAAIAAAHVLPPARLAPVLGLLAGQALLTELLADARY
jgi:methylthioxylose transferase